MSEIIQAGFGAALRRRREELKLTLDDVAASTRVRKAYLQALEEENLQALPGKAYAVGFLRIYARQLGLPVTQLLNALNGIEPDISEEPLMSASAGRPRLARKGKAKGRGSRLLLFTVLIAAVIGGLLYLKKKESTGFSRTETPPPAATEVPTPQPLQQQASPPVTPQAPLPAQVPGEVSVTSFTEFPVLPEGGAVVRIVPVGEGIMKVSLDGQEVREYQLQPDQSLNWKVAVSLACELTTPGLVRVWVDQQEIPVAEHSAFILKASPSQQEQRR